MSEKRKEYAIYPGQIKINNEIFFGLDYKLTDFYNELAEENKQLKYQLQQKENIITKLDNFLDKQIEKENQLLNPKKGVKPYGDEKFYYEIYKNCLFDIKLKLNRLKENKNE